MNHFIFKHHTTTNNKEKSMKTPTKRATRRLAASLAIITAHPTNRVALVLPRDLPHDKFMR